MIKVSINFNFFFYRLKDVIVLFYLIWDSFLFYYFPYDCYFFLSFTLSSLFQIPYSGHSSKLYHLKFSPYHYSLIFCFSLIFFRNLFTLHHTNNYYSSKQQLHFLQFLILRNSNYKQLLNFMRNHHHFIFQSLLFFEILGEQKIRQAYNSIVWMTIKLYFVFLVLCI